MSLKNNAGDESPFTGPSTRAVRAGEPSREVGAPAVNPIYQTTTFFSDPDGDRDLLYTRYLNNPNHRLLEERIGSLERAEACVVLGSGMAAATSAILSRVRAGDHVLAAEALYGGTRSLLERELARLGIETTFVDFHTRGWRDAIRPETRLLVAETVSNPLLRVTDPAPLAAAARQAGAALLVDATFSTPINLRALEHGADLVVHSATKYLGGHSDVTAGVVCGSEAAVQEVRARARVFGAVLDPHAAWLLERGVKTLAVRVQRHNENGMAVATWCAERPEIARVHYPGLRTHPDHETAARLLSGFGGMVSLELRGGEAAATRFVRALRLIKLAPSLGGVDSLVSEPRHTSHSAMTPDQRRALGIGDGFVRISLGIEDAEDIIADLERGLRAAG